MKNILKFLLSFFMICMPSKMIHPSSWSCPPGSPSLTDCPGYSFAITNPVAPAQSTVYPPGSYRNSCELCASASMVKMAPLCTSTRSCSSGAALSCLNSKGCYVDASIPTVPNCISYANTNGNLTCEEFGQQIAGTTITIPWSRTNSSSTNCSTYCTKIYQICRTNNPTYTDQEIFGCAALQMILDKASGFDVITYCGGCSSEYDKK